VVVPEVSELRDGDPASVVLENARRKARAGRELAGAGKGVTVLGVDTDVALGDRLLGKPEDERGARERLEALSGRTHEVLSGVVALGTAREVEPSRAAEAASFGGEVPVERAAVATTEVTFSALDPATIELYLASEEWRARAGAYAIQGLGSILIESISGDFSNVVGLPVPTLIELLPPNVLQRAANRRKP
jgi:septum formation protein